jgi:hypothetical protein
LVWLGILRLHGLALGSTYKLGYEDRSNSYIHFPAQTNRYNLNTKLVEAGTLIIFLVSVALSIWLNIRDRYRAKRQSKFLFFKSSCLLTHIITGRESFIFGIAVVHSLQVDSKLIIVMKGLETNCTYYCCLFQTWWLFYTNNSNKMARIARISFFLLFAWASWINWKTSQQTSQFYLDYAGLT